MDCLREVGNAVAAFLLKYVAIYVVSENLVEVDLASDTDDLAAGVCVCVFRSIHREGFICLGLEF